MALYDVDFHSYWRTDLPSPEVVCLATRITPQFNIAPEGEYLWLRKYGDTMQQCGFYDERSKFTEFHGDFTTTKYKPGFEHMKMKFHYEGKNRQAETRSETNVDGPTLGIKRGVDYAGREVITAFDRRVEGITEEEAHAICRRIHTSNQNMNIDQFMEANRNIIALQDREPLPPLTTHPTASLHDSSPSGYSPSSIPTPHASVRSSTEYTAYNTEYSLVHSATAESTETNPWRN